MTNSLMAGRRGLIMGVANDHSIAWGIAQQLHKIVQRMVAPAVLAFLAQQEPGFSEIPSRWCGLLQPARTEMPGGVRTSLGG